MGLVSQILLCGADYGHLDVVKLGLRIANVGPISANLRIEELSDINSVASFYGGPRITTNILRNGTQLEEGVLGRPLASAASGGFTNIVQILLDVGVGINEDCSDWRKTSLEVAAQAARAETVRFLLNRGASIKRRRGLRAITAAAKRGWLDVVDMLCDEGIVVVGTEENKLESNPMLTAIKYDQAHIIDFLLRKNVASIDRSSINPSTGELRRKRNKRTEY